MPWPKQVRVARKGIGRDFKGAAFTISASETKACAAALLVPLALLLGVEGVLRLAGYGYTPAFFVKGKALGQAVLLNNPKYGWRFFGRALARDCWPFTLSAHKPPETIRVFVMGESAAEGCR